MTKDEIEAKLKKINKKRKKLLKELDRAIERTIVACDGCRIAHVICDLTYIQTHWYTEPHGCTGGDYWNQGEGQWECPDCGHVNRLYNKPEIEKLKRYFATVVKTYKDR
jgi:rubredoxin